MSLEQVCQEQPNSCYTCANTNLDESDNLVCPFAEIKTQFDNDDETLMIKEYHRAVGIAKDCEQFKECSLFDH